MHTLDSRALGYGGNPSDMFHRRDGGQDVSSCIRVAHRHRLPLFRQFHAKFAEFTSLTLVMTRGGRAFRVPFPST